MAGLLAGRGEAAPATTVNRLCGSGLESVAIAPGHPLGMSGARLVVTATQELGNRAARFALCAMCIGVGQGIAMIIERV